MPWPRDERAFIAIGATTRWSCPRFSADMTSSTDVTTSIVSPSTEMPLPPPSSRILRSCCRPSRSFSRSLYTSRYEHCTMNVESDVRASTPSNSRIAARGTSP